MTLLETSIVALGFITLIPRLLFDSPLTVNITLSFGPKNKLFFTCISFKLISLTIKDSLIVALLCTTKLPVTSISPLILTLENVRSFDNIDFPVTIKSPLTVKIPLYGFFIIRLSVVKLLKLTLVFFS